MKKIFAILLCFVISFSSIPSFATDILSDDNNIIPDDAEIVEAVSEGDVVESPKSDELAETWFSEEEKNDDSHSFDEILDKYFESRKKHFITSNVDNDEIVDIVSESVLNDMNKRHQLVQQMQENMNSTFLDASITFNIENVETKSSEEYHILVNEWTFYDYDDLSDEVTNVDTSGFSTMHEMVVIKNNNNYIIETDAYTEADMNGMISSNYVVIDDTELSITDGEFIEDNESIELFANYSPDLAVAYADKYWENYNPNYSNYNSIGGDCANFLSQCLHAGGLDMTSGWYWYSYSNRSSSWTYCPDQVTYFKNLGTFIDNPSASQIKKGNPVWYKGSTTFAHAAICVGTNSSGTPIINAHNNDRYHVHWQLGGSSYWNGYGTVQLNGSSGTTDNYVNIGTGFTAVILNKAHWKTIENNSGIVRLNAETGKSKNLWYFERQSDGSYKITSCLDGRCLDVAGGSSGSGAEIWCCDSNNTNAQRWYFYEQSGGYVLRPKCSSCVLDLPNNSSANGTNLQTFTRNNSDAQIWSLYMGDECKLKAPTLSVTAGTPSTNTIFSWSEVYGESYYTLHIYKSGSLYKTIEGIDPNNYSITLPAGSYTAKVDAANYLNGYTSNTVSFTVNQATYTVSFFTENAADRSQKTVTYGQPYGTLPTISRTGYTFKGWYTATEGGEKISSSTIYNKTSNQILYSQWTPNTYTVTLKENDQYNSSRTISVKYGSAYSLPTLTQEGYTFDGWYTANSGGSKVTNSTTVSTASNHTLYGRWTPKTYTVTFDANGGTCSVSKLTYKYDVGFTEPTPTRPGYYFRGWYRTKNDGDSYDATATSYTLYAHWSYGVLFGDINNDGVVDGPDYVNIVYALQGKIELTDYMKSAGDVNGDGVVDLADGDLIADYRLGKISVFPVESMVNRIEIYSKPSKTEYFVGDTFSSSGLKVKVVYNNGTTETISSGFTLSSPTMTSVGTKTITVSHKKDNITKTTSFDIKVKKPTLTLDKSAVNVKVGQSVQLNSTTNSGVSVSWSSSNTSIAKVSNGKVEGVSAGTATITAQITKNGYKYSATCTVVVEKIVYDVIYNANGGNSAPAVQEKEYNKTLTLSSTKPTRTGYTFLGWATSSSATTATYSAGGSYTNNSSITLYAVWKIETYTVSFDANGGINPPNSITKNYGTSITLNVENPVRNGFKFLGWSEQPNVSYASYQNGDKIESNKSIVLYAVWEEEKILYISGDVNGDGEITFADAILILKHDAGISILEGTALDASDVNKDGSADFADAILILKFDAGLIDSL